MFVTVAEVRVNLQTCISVLGLIWYFWCHNQERILNLISQCVNQSLNMKKMGDRWFLVNNEVSKKWLKSQESSLFCVNMLVGVLFLSMVCICSKWMLCIPRKCNMMLLYYVILGPVIGFSYDCKHSKRSNSSSRRVDRWLGKTLISCTTKYTELQIF